MRTARWMGMFHVKLLPLTMATSRPRVWKGQWQANAPSANCWHWGVGPLQKRRKPQWSHMPPRRQNDQQQAALQVQQRQAPQKKTQKNLIRGQSSKRNPIVRVSCQVPAQLPSKATQYCSTRHSRRSRTNMEPNSIESKQANRALPPRQAKKKLNQSHARKSSSLYNKCFWIARQQIVCTPPGKLWLLMQRHTSLACIGHARLLAWKCQRPFCRASLQARGAKRQKAKAIGPRCNTFRARQVVFTQTCSWPTNLFLDAGLFKFLIWFATIN